MTAINITCQPRHRRLHVVSDAARYLADGLVVGIGPKVYNAPHWPGIVTSRGPAAAPAVLGQQLAARFQSFDDMIGRVEDLLPDIVRSCEILPTEGHPFHTFELLLAGWSAKRNAPESYLIRNTDDPPPGFTSEQLAALRAQNDDIVWPDAYKLCRLPESVEGPLIFDKALLSASGYLGIDVDDDPDVLVRDMLHCIETQRRQVSPGWRWHKVGGFAQLTTITPDGISQRILTRWSEDKIGGYIKPAPIDWARAFHILAEAYPALTK